ncbi:hypothetical protein DWB58_31840 [candidate division KSB1 bacterium]|nr:hypothetical protein [candidate division KSB1 bacterium]
MKKKSIVPEPSVESTYSDFNTWANSLPKNTLDIWREAMASLRALSGDVWNGVRFFLTVNAAVLAGIIAFARAEVEKPQFVTAVSLAFLSVIGIAVTLLARGIFFRQRSYYAQMLARKVLLDKELGFRDRRVGSLDLSFPWSVDDDSLSQLQGDPDAWIKGQLRPKSSIRRRLSQTYGGLLVVYTIVLLAALTDIYFNYYHVGNCK